MQRILVVETDNDTRTMLLIALQRQGYIVCGAPTAARGMRLIQKFQPDLIVIELELPVLSGWDMVRRINSSPNYCSVSTMALTTYNCTSHRLRAYLAGFDEVLVKPFDRNQFLQRIHTLLCRQSAGRSQDPGVALC